MFDEIVQKIAEERNNLIAQAFTMQIGSLLKSNGIVPIMTEHTLSDAKTITDINKYNMVMEFRVSFDELDTTEHDAKVKADAIDECIKAITNFCGGLPNNNLISALEQLEEKNMENEFFNFDEVVEIEKKKSYNQALEDCCNVLRQSWLNGTAANRIIKEQIAEIEKLKI